MIITPETIREQERRRSEEHAYWMTIYNNNPKVKKLADAIHNSRMVSPPTCDDCIRIAVMRLNPEEKQDKSKPNTNWVDAPFEAGVFTFGKDGQPRIKVVHSLEEMQEEFDSAQKPNEMDNKS